MNINLTDYNRSGIFIEEINSSTIDRQAPQDAITNFIPGFSRKGTVFNRPILIKSKNDRLTYFGDIDRYLEKKGSFFHRTIDVALQTAPVYAMNLLKTNSLDKLNYASISVAAQYDNAPVASQQYDDFFNKAGFWNRDTESFLYFAQDTEKMIHFVNVGDKKISVFMFKSAVPGFDITAETWYGGRDKVPTWMNYYDFISDYMVRVIAVTGDWSNYTTLAADTIWSKYFNASGLRKNKANDFIRDNSVTLLGDYNGSLIPYFRDDRDNNIFIETIINLDTDRTGLFCAFDIENVETDFYNGNIDIIGESLVDLNKSKINFMSYQDTIEETDSYEQINLDVLGNVIATNTIGARTANNVNGKVTGITFTIPIATTDLSVNPINITAAGGANAIINNTKKTLVTTPLTFQSLPVPGATLSTYRIDVITIDPNGLISVMQGQHVMATPGLNELQATTNANGALTYPTNYTNNTIIVGYLFRERLTSSTTFTYVPVSNSASAFLPLNMGVVGTDILVNNTLPTNVLELEFKNTANVTKANYKAWRSLQFFNELVTKTVMSNAVIIDSLDNKISLTNATWSDNFSASIGNKKVKITVPVGNIQTQALTNNFVIYYLDNEFTMGKLGLETRKSISGTTNFGIVSKNSEFFMDFYNGMINTGDYFYVNFGTTTSLKFVHSTNITNVGDYIIMTSADATTLGIGTGANNTNVLISTHTINNGNYSIRTGVAFGGGSFATGLQADGYLLAGEIAFSVEELVTTYVNTQPLNVYDYDKKVYLKMYSVSNDLKVEFMADNTLITPISTTWIDLSSNSTILVYSGEAAYTQTLEVEYPTGYVMTDNKILIDLVRYPEVKVGDFVKAYVDVLALQPGEYAKKFARIIKKVPWSGNNATYKYAEITTDIRIHLEEFSGDYQTTRYTKVEDYIDTYKAIVMNGFTVQGTSIPDGTEAKQAEILDILVKGSSLFNAIINKDKFNFRYLTDSFGLGLTEFSKQQLADITGKRKNCISFLNMPSAKTFLNSSNPAFINVDGTLNLEYVRLGGNPEENPAFLYSLAQGSGKDDGRDTVGYFFPYVTVNDNGRPLAFPPASYIANTYMRKINSNVSGVYNWTVAAGTEDGLVKGISNTEMDFTEFDLEQMYRMGINPINYARNIGHYIETEFTASTEKISSLSFLHVREILIDLENELYFMLKKYQWKFNTPSVRAKIKREADAICQKYVDRSALYAFENIIDDTNNTPVLIDNQFGLLETKIEAVKAMGTIVNVINVMQTGAIGSSTGFN